MFFFLRTNIRTIIIPIITTIEIIHQIITLLIPVLMAFVLSSSICFSSYIFFSSILLNISLDVYSFLIYLVGEI